MGAAELEDTFTPGGYYDGYWPRLAEAFAAYVHRGTTGPLLAAYDRLAAVDAEGDNGYSVYTAVQCRDAPGRATGTGGGRTPGRRTRRRR